MQVEAIYNQGRIELPQHVRLRHDRVHLLVTIPDDEIEPRANPYNLSPEVLQQAAEMRQRMDAARRAPLSPDHALRELTSKQLERIEAFEFRAQLRRELGRPV